MKRTTSPKTKVFSLSTPSFVTLMAAFMVFHLSEHSNSFRDFVMSTPRYKSCLSLAYFKHKRPVRGVDIVFHYE